MKVKIQQNGMLIDATIVMKGDMMVVIPVNESRKEVLIKNGELITLVDSKGGRWVYMANCISEQYGYKILHYHARIDDMGDLGASGKISLQPFTIEEPTKREVNTFMRQLEKRGLIWDAESGWLTNFFDGMIVTCGWSDQYRSFQWVCACKDFERELDKYFIEDYCGTYLNDAPEGVEPTWDFPDTSDSATFIRKATQEELNTLYGSLAAINLKWNYDTLSLDKIR